MPSDPNQPFGNLLYSLHVGPPDLRTEFISDPLQTINTRISTSGATFTNVQLQSARLSAQKLGLLFGVEDTSTNGGVIFHPKTCCAQEGCNPGAVKPRFIITPETALKMIEVLVIFAGIAARRGLCAIAGDYLAVIGNLVRLLATSTQFEHYVSIYILIGDAANDTTVRAQLVDAFSKLIEIALVEGDHQDLVAHLAAEIVRLQQP